MSSIILTDQHSIHDSIGGRNLIDYRMSAGPKRTKIVITNHDTGEIIDEVSNKILVPGSQMTACKQFGIDYAVKIPTYNEELGLENSYDSYAEQPHNTPITCLFCVGRGGAGAAPGEIMVVSNIDRIEPENDILPFRYVDPSADLDDEQRAVYYGRKVEDSGKIAYYFKTFDTTPQLHVRYLDGTEVTPSIYKIESSQQVEIFVEMRLSVSRFDFREYFDQVLGWDNADISTLSLLTAWYDNTSFCENPDAEPGFRKYYKWYQDVLPFSKFNFKRKDLIDLTEAVDFNYQIYY